jgi:uncharacterized membrane protein YkvA (DUF1232 family)
MLRKLIPNVFRPAFWGQITQEMLIVWRLLRDQRVSWGAKILPILGIIYLVVPVDLVPGFIPVLGQLDDLAILMLVSRAFVHLVPKDIVAEYERQRDTQMKHLG